MGYQAPSKLTRKFALSKLPSRGPSPPQMDLRVLFLHASLFVAYKRPLCVALVLEVNYMNAEKHSLMGVARITIF